MSGPWAAAVMVLALLVLALTLVVARLLTVVTSTNRALVALQEQVRWLGTTPGAPAEVLAPTTALVTLDPACASCRQLALDLRATGLPDVGGVALRLLAEDSGAGRRLTEGLDAETVTAGSGSELVPHVVVTASDGRVLAKGDPASAAELERLISVVA